MSHGQGNKAERRALQSECRNCGHMWNEGELDVVQDLFQRVSAGEPMPSGQCPDCGALCQPAENELALNS